ncbi:hypothetical protein HMPREF9515_00180 [Enterococcus faecalis TX0860]|nr:hypothetical protein HMPREF9515_00180 [Enterococcus faecalis TX0860]
MRKRDVKEKPKYYRLKLYNVRVYQKRVIGKMTLFLIFLALLPL